MYPAKNNALKAALILALLLIFIPAVQAQREIAAADSVRLARLTDTINKLNSQNPALADSFAHVYYAEARKLNNDDYIGRGAGQLMNVSLITGNMDQAMEWYAAAKKSLARAQDHLWLGYTNMNMGIMLNRKYNFEKGFPYLLESTKNFELAHNNNMLTSAYTNISTGYHDFGNYEKGKEYAELALKIIGRDDNIKRSYQWQAYNALGINYDDNKEYRQAILTHLKALPLADNGQFLCTSYNNLGNTSKKMGKLADAVHYFELALVEVRKLQDNYQLATVYGNLADIARLQHQYNTADKYADSALYYSRKSESPEKLLDAYVYAYQVKTETGNYKLANQYLEQYVSLKDSLFNADKARMVYNYQEQYEAEKKQKLIQQQQFEISKKNYWLLMAGIAILLISIAAYLIYRNTRHRQDKKLQQEIFRQQEIESGALFEGEQQERVRIARDLHDGVGQMLSFLKMHLSTVARDTPGLQKSQELLDKTIGEIRNVSHNLMPEELNFGIVAALENLADNVRSSGDIQMETDIAEAISALKLARQNELSIYRIVQEVVSNMVKHARATLIHLSVQHTGSSLFITIKDNGRGLEDEAITNAKGIGWKNIKARVHLMSGKINVRSGKLSGTQIEITLPQNEQ